MILPIMFYSVSGEQERIHTDVKNNDLKGLILNNQDEPVSYAHLYLESSETGTITDFDGEFPIPDSWSDDGTVVISAIGYSSKTLSVDELRTRSNRNTPIILSPKDYGLEELTVSASSLKSGSVKNYGFLQRVLGYGGAVGGFSPPENRVAYSRAQRIDIDRKPPYWLNSITLWIGVNKWANQNSENLEQDESDSSKEALIRINLVDVAEDGSPGENSYLSEPIYLLIDDSERRQKIDLSSYNLMMNESQFYIVAEFIVDDLDSFNGYFPTFSAGKRGDGSYYRGSPFKPWSEDSLLDEFQIMYKAEYLY
ncbi:MAG: carboxypeptidase-like regulatory domain-containing protein [Balneolaceae bacterium]